MTEQNGQTASAVAGSRGRFRLVLHIGAGKTGTSSIQESLRRQYDELKRRGTWYLGLMLENAPCVEFRWQKRGDAREFLALESRRAIAELLEVLRSSIPKMEEAGCRQAIWSNEALFRRGTDGLITAIRQLELDGVDVLVVAYVRRHDAWARSAYLQWGLKHKTYKGPLESFDEWVKRSPPSFAGAIRPWIDAFAGRVLVRNIDGIADAVPDFLACAGVEAEGLVVHRANETAQSEELLFRALFNEQFGTPAGVEEFDGAVGKGVDFERHLSEWFSGLMPGDAALENVVSSSGEDRKALNELLLSSGQAPIDTSPLPVRSLPVDSLKVLGAVCQMVVRQAAKIQELERNMAGMPVVAADAAEQEKAGQPNRMERARPVFALSTGRSGSTLVQRILNCHEELVIWGEHFGFLDGIGSAYSQMLDPEQILYRENKGPAVLLPTLQDPGIQLEWVNPWSAEEFKEQVRGFMHAYFAGRLQPNQRWGFKEIRYNNMPTLRMLKDLYPEGKFIFIKRDPIEVTRSKVFSFVKEDKWNSFTVEVKEQRVKAMLKEVYGHYRVYDTFMQRNPGRGLIVSYEELVANPQAVTEAMLAHAGLDPARYDWALGGKVMGSVIAKTKRDDDVVQFIRRIASVMELA